MLHAIQHGQIVLSTQKCTQQQCSPCRQGIAAASRMCGEGGGSYLQLEAGFCLSLLAAPLGCPPPHLLDPGWLVATAIESVSPPPDLPACCCCPLRLWAAPLLGQQPLLGKGREEEDTKRSELWRQQAAGVEKGTPTSPKQAVPEFGPLLPATVSAAIPCLYPQSLHTAPAPQAPPKDQESK